MSFRPSAVFLHASAAAVMAYGFNALGSLNTDEYIRQQTGGHFQFLTIQGLIIAWLTMVTSLVVDLLPSLTILQRTKRILFMVAMPVEVVVSTVYWTLLLSFPDLIIMQRAQKSVPSSSSEVPVDFRIPLPVDLALHASPALALLADFVLFEHKYTAKEARYGAPIVAALFTLWYSTWVEYFGSVNGTFPYPFLTENPFEIRVGIYFGAAVLALTSFWTINSLHR